MGHIFHRHVKTLPGIIKDNSQIFLFWFCPKWWFEKEVSFIFARLTPNLLDIFSYPYNCPMPKFNSICLVNIPEQFFKVPVWGNWLWRKYKLGISKWVENFQGPYDQIMTLHQIWAHVTHPCEPSFKSLFLGQIFTLWSNYILYCFIIVANLPGHDPDHTNSLCQILAHLI